MVQSTFGKMDEFIWWDMEIIKTDSGTQFSSRYFQEGLSICVVQLSLPSSYHQGNNVQVQVTWRTLQTIAHSIMMHAQISDKYIHFSLMYTTDHIYSVLRIKYLVNQYGEPTNPHTLPTGKKPSVSNPSVLFSPQVVLKAIAHVNTKALNIRH